MTFNVDVVDFPWTAMGFMVGAVLVLLLAFLLSSQVSLSFTSLLTLGAILSLFTFGILMLHVPETEQAKEITAQTEALPGVSSSVISETSSVPICRSGVSAMNTVVNVITEDGESVDGQLVVSEPKDGACTYELKLPTE